MRPAAARRPIISMMSTELALYRITGGRCEYSEELVSGGPEALEARNLQPSYEGKLFRVRYELRGAGPRPQRLWVGSTGQIDAGRIHAGPPDGYALLGLRGNPFVLERYAPRGEPWEGVAAEHWLERGHSAPPPPSAGLLVQLLGVKGAGKSSHLARWRSEQPGPYAYYPREYLGRWHRPPLGPICYWDEACRIPALLLGPALLEARRQRATVCVGTHRDLGPAARAAGLQVQTIRFGELKALKCWPGPSATSQPPRCPGRALNCSLTLP